MKNNQKGITLIALVITIIILLILASVSLQAIEGNNGIIKKTNESASNAERESIIQKIQADLYNEKIIKNKMPNKAELKKIIEEKYGSHLDDTKFTSEVGGYEIQYEEIIGWEDN